TSARRNFVRPAGDRFELRSGRARSTHATDGARSGETRRPRSYRRDWQDGGGLEVAVCGRRGEWRGHLDVSANHLQRRAIIDEKRSLRGGHTFSGPSTGGKEVRSMAYGRGVRP